MNPGNAQRASFARPLSLLLLLTLICLGSPAARAATSTLPTVESVQQQLDTLADQGLDAARQTAQREALQETLRWLNELADNQRRQQRLQQRLDEAPAETLRLTGELARLPPADAEQIRQQSLPEYEALNVEQLVARLIALLNEQEDLQQSLSDAQSDMASNQILPERAQSAISAVLDELEAARSALIRLNVRDDALENQATANLLSAQIATLNSRLDLHQLELQANSELQTLASRQSELLQRRVADIDAHLAVLQDVLDQKRRAQTAAAIRAASEQVANLPGNRLLAAQRDINQQLAQRVLEVTGQVNEQLRLNLQLRNQLDKVRQLERSLNEQVAALQGSLLLSRILYQQQRMLPTLDPAPGAVPDIANLRLEQFQITEQREALLDIDSLAQRWMADSGDAGNEEVRDTLVALLAARRDLLQQLDPELSRLLALAINSETSRRQLAAANRATRNTIQEQLFWMPSSRPLNATTLRSLPSTLAQQVRQARPVPVTEQVLARLQERWPGPALAAALALVLVLRRRAFKRQLTRLNQQVGLLKQDSQQHTPLAIALVILLTAPVPLVLASLGLALRTGDALAATVTGAVLLKLAMIVLVFGSLMRLCERDGVMIRHFRYAAEPIRLLRRNLLYTGILFLPLGIVIAMGERAPELLADDMLGLLVVLFSGPLLSVLLWRLASHYPSAQRVRLVRYTTVAVIAAIPLVLTVLCIVGYYYTAVRLGGRLVDTFYLLLLWLVVAATLRRGLTLAARRIAYRRALARREEQKHQKESDAEAGEAVEEPPMDLDLVNTQSLRLANLFLLLAFGVAVYWVWADLIGAMSYLENVVLWQQTVTEGDQVRITTTSLADLLFGLLVLSVALMMARNLPGLLEVLVLSRLALRPGSAYTITSMLAYTITGIGIVVALSSLGIAWDKLQWLVAALGVGLGFGLQEIFGNFVSGLIILFERPVRIGDLVTIGDLSGTVTRIRIRATTIRDFDSKEIIIPNKAFVTERLINWTLSDNVTRIVVKVGFAYGSDVELARSVLLQAAAENPRVMQTPPPAALFIAFGASSLDHELRVHVRELSDRIPASDELHRRIDALCREKGLEIAFSQLDVYIKNKAGDEITIRSQQEGGPGQG